MGKINDNVAVFLEDLIMEMEHRKICSWRIVEVAEYVEVTVDDKVYAQIDKYLYEKIGSVYVDHEIGDGEVFDGIIIIPITDGLAVVIDYII